MWVDTIAAGVANDASARDDLVARLAETQAELASMTTALHHVNFAAEKLREAFEEQGRAFELMEQAQQAHRRAVSKMVAADLARQEAMAPFTVEDMPAP